MRSIVTLAGCLAAAVLLFSAPLAAQETAYACPAERVVPAGRPRKVDPRDSVAMMTADSIRDELRRAAADAAAAAGTNVLEGLMLVDEPSRGRFRIRTHRSNLPPEAHPAILAAATATRARWPRRSGEYAHTIRLAPGDSAMLIPDGAVPVQCRPAVMNRGEMTTLVETWLGQHMDEAPPRHTGQFRATVLALVTREGDVVFAELSRRSGWRLFDDAAPGLAAAMRMDVARLDGKPLDVWIELPVTVHLPLPPEVPRSRAYP